MKNIEVSPQGIPGPALYDTLIGRKYVKFTKSGKLYCINVYHYNDDPKQSVVVWESMVWDGRIWLKVPCSTRAEEKVFPKRLAKIASGFLLSCVNLQADQPLTDPIRPKEKESRTATQDAPRHLIRQHTPGPWQAYGGQVYEGANGDGDTICTMMDDDDVATAVLIAGAPELLEALKALLDDMAEAHSDELATNHHGDGNRSCTYCQNMQAGHAAVAKAEGR